MTSDCYSAKMADAKLDFPILEFDEERAAIIALDAMLRQGLLPTL
jgi:hypothetical protein